MQSSTLTYRILTPKYSTVISFVLLLILFIYRSPQTDYAKQVKFSVHVQGMLMNVCTLPLIKLQDVLQHDYCVFLSLLCQNGGKFEFIIDRTAALPVDPSFWDYLLSSSQQKWDLWVYEQDWLYVQYTKTNELLVSEW